jgi:predicted lipid-binding transport protein (Tim44 family)
MTGDDDLSRLVEACVADPAVQAAADQLRAALTGPPPGQDPAVFAGRQRAALRAIVRAAMRRIAAEAPFPLTPDVLEAAARYFEDREPPHETRGGGGVT